MDRLDKAIADISYILDTLMAYRNIAKTGNCNTCKIKSECGACPKPGQLVRYNCMRYVEIVEIEDEPSFSEDGLTFYKCVDAPWWYISDMHINRMKPYKGERGMNELKPCPFCGGKGQFCYTNWDFKKNMRYLC